MSSAFVWLQVLSPNSAEVVNSMVAQLKKPRTPCDKSYGVAQAIELLHDMLGAGSRDLTACLAKLFEDWKAQPKPEVMMPYVGLAKALARKCPSLLPTPSTILSGIIKLDEQHGPVNYSGLERGKWADLMSGKLRCLFSKWRRVALEPHTQTKFMLKLSSLEKKQVNELLALMKSYVDEAGETQERANMGPSTNVDASANGKAEEETDLEKIDEEQEETTLESQLEGCKIASFLSTFKVVGIHACWGGFLEVKRDLLCFKNLYKNLGQFKSSLVLRWSLALP